MDPISSTDRLVLLLRQKLQERAKSGARATEKHAPSTEPSTTSPLQALAATEGQDERHLRRAFIQHLLADQLGSAFLNDARFQQVVTRVTDVIELDEVASGLLSRLLVELRSSG